MFILVNKITLYIYINAKSAFLVIMQPKFNIGRPELCNWSIMQRRSIGEDKMIYMEIWQESYFNVMNMWRIEDGKLHFQES